MSIHKDNNGVWHSTKGKSGTRMPCPLCDSFNTFFDNVNTPGNQVRYKCNKCNHWWTRDNWFPTQTTPISKVSTYLAFERK